MISAGYVCEYCPRCAYNEYRKGTNLGPPYNQTWVGEWLRLWCAPGTECREWIGTCLGCYNVGIEKMKVLAIFLYDLGINPRGLG